MKYKLGDKVWILDSSKLSKGKVPGTTVWYQINTGETDIRGIQVTITRVVESGETGTECAYYCKEYALFFDIMIDDVKTQNNIQTELNYEIY